MGVFPPRRGGACPTVLVGKLPAAQCQLLGALPPPTPTPPPHPTAPLPNRSSYSAPSIIVVNIGITTADVSVAPPATAPDGGWAKYVLTLCRVGGSCSKQDCTAVSGRATRTLCALTGLVKNTNYTVSAAAVNGTISSKQSAEKAFKTSNQE